MIIRHNGTVPIRFAALPALLLLVFGCNQPSEAVPPEAGDSPGPVEKAETASRPAPLSGVSILRPSITPPEPEAPPRPPEPLTAIISFAEAGTSLDEAARAMLDRLVDQPEVQAGGAITLRGHTDSGGGDRENLRVATARAEAVARYLVAKGANQERITIIPLGERRPIAPNAHPDGTDNPEGRAQNRRVEIEVAPIHVVVEEAAPVPDVPAI